MALTHSPFGDLIKEIIAEKGGIPPEMLNEEIGKTGKEIMEENHKFRLQASALLLTYRTHVDKQKYRKWLEEEFDKTELILCEIAHEKECSETNYEHSHIVIEWNNRIDTKNCRRLDYEDIHPHIKKLSGKKAIRDALKYISKEDEDPSILKALKKYSMTKTELLKGKTIEEALNENVQKWSDVGGIIMAHKLMNNVEPKLKELPEKQDWHLELDKLIEESTCRDIFWVFGKRGNEGKTLWARHEVRKGKCIYATSMTSLDSFSNYLLSQANKKPDFDTIIIDLCRTMEERTLVLYSMLEICKNGLIQSSKYEGGMKEFNPPKVIVFSNWYPDIDNLSKDRWKIYEIVNNDSSTSSTGSNNSLTLKKCELLEREDTE